MCHNTNMGFQQKILDHIFVAFLTSISSISIALFALFISMYSIYLGLFFNLIGALFIFIFCYKYYYTKRFYPIPKNHQIAWLLILSMSFSFAFSIPILGREKILSENLELFGTLIPLVSFVGFEIYSFKNSLQQFILKN